MSTFKIPIIGSFLEGFAAEFKKKIKPVPGCVLKCDLAGGANFLGGSLCHTGIYLGNDRIAEIVPDDESGKAVAHSVEPIDFLNGQGTNFLRTGINIYVATDGEGRALGSAAIAKRAQTFCRARRSHGNYDLVDNNCHKFTVRCVIGCEPTEAKLNERDIEEALEETFGCNRVTWEPTGFSVRETSFNDIDYSDDESDL